MNKVMLKLRQSTQGTIRRYYAFTLLQSLAFFAAVLVPFFTEWGGITLVQTQFLQSWFMFWIFVLEIPTGAVADYLGRKHSLALGALVYTLAMVVYGSVPDFRVFLAAELLFALAIALISGADKALLYDALKEAGRVEQAGKIFGRVHALHLLGMLVAAPVGSLIAGRFGLNSPMLFSAVPYGLSVLVAWSMPEPKRAKAESESTRYLEVAKRGLAFFRYHRQLKLMAIDATLVASAAYFVIWFYQPLLIRLKIPVIYFGWFHAGLVGVEMLVAANFVRFEKLFRSAANFLKFSALVTALAFGLVAVFPSLVTTLVFIILAGGFGLTRIELVSAKMNQLIPSEQRATVLSSVSMFRRFALVPLNPIMGALADHSLRTALLAVSFLPLGTLFIKTDQKQSH